MKYLFQTIFIVIFLTSCAKNQPVITSSATILIKTPTMKFYDKGFILKHDSFTQVQIYNAGQNLLDMKIYDDEVCVSTFKCQSLNDFNNQNLHSSYKKNFLKTLFDNPKKEIVHRDKENGILIKIKKD